MPKGLGEAPRQAPHLALFAAGRMAYGRFMDGLAAYLFSFNRGPHLAAALDGLARLAPGLPVTIVDDDSDDPATLEAIARSGRPTLAAAPDAWGRHGGLYANMQRALEAARAPWLLMTQDDLQPFRPLGPREAEVVERAFGEEPARAVLSVHLPMGRRQGRNRRRLRRAGPLGWVADDPGDDNAVRTHYCDVCVLHRERLLARGFRFAQGEGATACRLREMGFAPMLHLAHPWLVRMPLVPTWRGRRRTLAMRLDAMTGDGEPRLFREMDEEEAAAFLQAGSDLQPSAEEWLHPASGRLRRPYEHKAVNRLPLLRALNKLEMRLRGGR